MSKPVWLICVLGLGVVVSCRPPATPTETGGGGENSAEATRVFDVKGVVHEVRPVEGIAVIAHEEIPGYMMAMKMELAVKDTNELAGVEVGDVVTFRMLVSQTDGWIDSVRKVGHDPTVAPEVRKGPRVVPMVDPLEIGDLVPDYTFTNQAGRAFSLSDYRGKVLGMTFFFTRCPYPTFCPRMSSQFAEASERLSDAAGGLTNWHLLSLSFDPDNDTPSVLRTYGESYGQDPQEWTLATGEMSVIDAITEQFGLMFGRDGEFFSHNSRTVILDAAGRVSQVITGNTWTVEEFLTDMRAAGRAGPSSE